MDFGTMRKKIENNEYSSIDQFKVCGFTTTLSFLDNLTRKFHPWFLQDDFALVCNNCRTYNAPDTIYYKSAEKIWKSGEKAILREKKSILLEEERERAERDAELVGGFEDGGRRLKGKKVIILFVSVGGLLWINYLLKTPQTN